MKLILHHIGISFEKIIFVQKGFFPIKMQFKTEIDSGYKRLIALKYFEWNRPKNCIWLGKSSRFGFLCVEKS